MTVQDAMQLRGAVSLALAADVDDEGRCARGLMEPFFRDTYGNAPFDPNRSPQVRERFKAGHIEPYWREASGARATSPTWLSAGGGAIRLGLTLFNAPCSDWLILRTETYPVQDNSASAFFSAFDALGRASVGACLTEEPGAFAGIGRNLRGYLAVYDSIAATISLVRCNSGGSQTVLASSAAAPAVGVRIFNDAGIWYAQTNTGALAAAADGTWTSGTVGVAQFGGAAALTPWGSFLGGNASGFL